MSKATRAKHLIRIKTGITPVVDVVNGDNFATLYLYKQSDNKDYGYVLEMFYPYTVKEILSEIKCMLSTDNYFK